MSYTDNVDINLVSATPTIDNASNVVKSWNLVIRMVFVDDDGRTLTKDFYKDVNVNYLGKAWNQFTKSELIALTNVTHMKNVFESTYISTMLPPPDRTEEINILALAD